MKQELIKLCPYSGQHAIAIFQLISENLKLAEPVVAAAVW